jgi:hypothetical protein
MLFFHQRKQIFITFANEQMFIIKNNLLFHHGTTKKKNAKDF